MSGSILKPALVLLLVFAVYGSGSLAWQQWSTGDSCPVVLGIPVCYVVFGCFTLGLTSLLFHTKWASIIYFASIGLVFLIATYGSTGEIFGFAECPKTAMNIPMCFVSWFICFFALIGRWALLRN